MNYYLLIGVMKKQQTNQELLDNYLLTYVKRDTNLKDKQTKEYIDKNKLSIRILESKWNKFLSIFKRNNLIFQQVI